MRAKKYFENSQKSSFFRQKKGLKLNKIFQVFYVVCMPETKHLFSQCARGVNVLIVTIRTKIVNTLRHIVKSKVKKNQIIIRSKLC